jgi:hypothetical protein
LDKFSSHTHTHHPIYSLHLCADCKYSIINKKKQKRADQDVTVTHATVWGLCRRIEGVGHKLYMDNFFSSPDLFDELKTKDITCCGTVRLNRKGLPDDFRRRQFRLKKGDIRVRVRGDMTTLIWKDKHDVPMLTNSYPRREDWDIPSTGKRLLALMYIPVIMRFFYDNAKIVYILIILL